MVRLPVFFLVALLSFGAPALGEFGSGMAEAQPKKVCQMCGNEVRYTRAFLEGDTKYDDLCPPCHKRAVKEYKDLMVCDVCAAPGVKGTCRACAALKQGVQPASASGAGRRRVGARGPKCNSCEELIQGLGWFVPYLGPTCGSCLASVHICKSCGVALAKRYYVVTGGGACSVSCAKEFQEASGQSGKIEQVEAKEVQAKNGASGGSQSRGNHRMMLRLAVIGSILIGGIVMRVLSVR